MISTTNCIKYEYYRVNCIGTVNNYIIYAHTKRDKSFIDVCRGYEIILGSKMIWEIFLYSFFQIQSKKSFGVKRGDNFLQKIT